MPTYYVSLWLVVRWLRTLVLAVLATPILAVTAPAQTASLDELFSSVVGIKTSINPEGRTTDSLGQEREGSGIVIDDTGLVLTIGYLMVEADTAEIRTSAGRKVPASVVGYDAETGFGLLRAIVPLNLQPITFGRSSELKERDPVLIAGFGSTRVITPAQVVSKRPFAGNWEYLLDEAIFTSPPHPEWSGAALINRAGKLVGVGSLVVRDAGGKGDGLPGNMFVPVDLLLPILSDLTAKGRVTGPGRPWLGVTANETPRGLVVERVTPESPAEAANLQRGDIIVGVNGERPADLADFYRKAWKQGGAGSLIPLDLMRNNELRRVDVRSMNRLDHLRLRSTL
jgi:S1-C subfamily serine protease